jgi:FkbM family methyltransferase
MKSILKFLYRRAAIAVARPYTRRELPGWGFVYRGLIGGHERDWLWQSEAERWVRGKLHGYLMSVRIGGWSNRSVFFLERFYDLPTQLLLQRELAVGDTFIDVGANEGMITLLASRLVGPTGTVIAFEPNPAPRTILFRNLQRNAIANVELHGSGLGDEDGEFQLFVPRVNSGEGSFTRPIDETAGDYVACPISVGDAVIGARRPKVIKIDVEGFEAHVLRGLTGTLVRDRPLIVMEMIAGHLERDRLSPDRLCAWLASLGYEGYRLGLRGRHELKLTPMSAPWRDGDYALVHRESANSQQWQRAARAHSTRNYGRRR